VHSIYGDIIYDCQIVAIHAMHGYMLKHDYYNIIQTKSCRPSYNAGIIFLMHIYPSRYLMAHATSSIIHFLLSQLYVSLLTISMWYHIELTSSNRVPIDDRIQQQSVINWLFESIYSIPHWYGYKCYESQFENLMYISGGKFQITYKILRPYLLPDI
jgi:hypothetical protein